MIGIKAAAESHMGYVRTNNEDLAVVSSDLAAIADGMGGHLGGEVAARIAIEELVEAFQRDRTASGLVTAVRRANRAIWRQSKVDRQLHGMGTTLTAAAVVPVDGDEPGASAHLALVNIGDSRAYRLESGTDGPGLRRLTEDHSVVEEMVRQGELTPAEAAVHPHRHVLTRVLGVDAEVDLDIWDLEPEPGTRLLLCSDGLTDEVPEEEIARVLASSEDNHEVARELVGRALAHGGLDNVTVVVVDVVEKGSSGSDGGQPLEMVPAQPPMPDQGDAGLGSDVTQAVPITRPAGQPDRASDPASDSPPTGPHTDELDATVPGVIAGAAAAQLYDAEADEGDPTVASTQARPDEEPAVAGPGAAGDPTVADFPLEATGEDTGRIGGPAHRRRARSMTVTAAAPSSMREDQALASGPATRGMVLVPTKKLSKQYRDRIVTFRVFVFLVLLAGIIGGVIAVVIWFQRSSYYVGLDGDRVSIYQGRPGGMLWFKPQLLETSAITTKDLLPNSVAEVRRGITESSYPAARQEVADLSKLSNELGMAPKSTTSTTLGTSTTTSTTAGST